VKHTDTSPSDNGGWGSETWSGRPASDNTITATMELSELVGLIQLARRREPNPGLELVETPAAGRAMLPAHARRVDGLATLLARLRTASGTARVVAAALKCRLAWKQQWPQPAPKGCPLRLQAYATAVAWPAGDPVFASEEVGRCRVSQSDSSAASATAPSARRSASSCASP
jgi:hypothetical protein